MPSAKRANSGAAGSGAFERLRSPDLPRRATTPLARSEPWAARAASITLHLVAIGAAVVLARGVERAAPPPPEFAVELALAPPAVSGNLDVPSVAPIPPPESSDESDAPQLATPPAASPIESAQPAPAEASPAAPSSLLPPPIPEASQLPPPESDTPAPSPPAAPTPFAETTRLPAVAQPPPTAMTDAAKAYPPAPRSMPPPAPRRPAPPMSLHRAGSQAPSGLSTALPRSETTPASTPAAASAVAPSPPQTTSEAIASEWQSALGRWLASRKTYPEAARERDEEGRVVVRFTVIRDGTVLSVSVVRSSGIAALDDAAQAMLRGARLPPFPETMTQSQVNVTVPIAYSLGR